MRGSLSQADTQKSSNSDPDIYRSWKLNRREDPESDQRLKSTLLPSLPSVFSTSCVVIFPDPPLLLGNVTSYPKEQGVASGTVAHKPKVGRRLRLRLCLHLTSSVTLGRSVLPVDLWATSVT